VSRAVGDIENAQVEGVAVAEWIGVVNGNRAVDTMARLEEIDIEMLLDDEIRVGAHGEVGVEARDDEAAQVGRGRTGGDHEKGGDAAGSQEC